MREKTRRSIKFALVAIFAVVAVFAIFKPEIGTAAGPNRPRAELRIGNGRAGRGDHRRTARLDREDRDPIRNGISGARGDRDDRASLQG